MTNGIHFIYNILRQDTNILKGCNHDSKNIISFLLPCFPCNGEDTPSKNDTTNTVEEIQNEDSAENTTDPEDTSEEEIPSNEECGSDIVEPLTWFEFMSTNKAEGDIYFGQTCR